MPWEEVAEGPVWTLGSLSQYENELEEGSRNLLELDLRLPVSKDVARQLEDTLKDAGVEGVRVTTASPMLKIYWRKGFPWLLVIVAAILGLIVLAALIISWRLFTYIGAIAPAAIPLMAIAGIGLLVLIGVSMVRRKA